MSRNNTVLVISEGQEQFSMAVSSLRDTGSSVFFACNVNHGLKIAESELPGLIISELAMADVDGLELCRRVRGDKKLRSTPILLVGDLSSNSSIVKDGLRCGASDYVEKPINQRNLFDRCSGLIGLNSRDAVFDPTDGFFQSLIENISDIITIVAADGTILFESPSVERVLGYKPGELVGHGAFDLVHPDDVTEVLNYFHLALRSFSTSPPIEYRFRHKDGSWKFVESIGKPFNDPQRGLVGVVTSRDTTERKNMLEAKRESEERFRAQYEGLPIPTFTWRKVDDDLIFENYNVAADKLTHGRLSAIIGQKVSDVFKERPDVVALFHRCVNEQITIPFNGPYRFAITGELKHLDVNFVFIKPDIVMAGCRDITEQIEAEELLRRSRERFEMISAATNDGLWDWDLLSNSLWLNEASYNLLGISTDEVAPAIDDWYSSIHPEDKDRVVSGVRDVINTGGKYWSDEYRIPSKDDSCKYVFDRGYVVYDDDGKPVRMIGAAIDITEGKSAENELRHNKQVYESLIESIEGIVWEADAKMLNFSFVSKQAERLLGYSTEQWINEPNFWAEHLHPDDRERVVELCKSATARLENHESDYRIIAADGRTVWLHDIVTVDASDKDKGRLRGVMVDITASKQAETALAEANQRAICEYVRLLERLSTLGQQLGTARDLTSVFAAINEFAHNSVPCSAMLISLFDKEKSIRNAIYVCYNGKEGDVSGLQSLPVREGPVGKALRHGEVVVLDDYMKIPGKKPTYIYLHYDEDPRDPHSAIIAPMKIMGEVIGVLEVQSYETAAYTQEHATAMRMAANMTANAIENVRLIEMEQIRAEQFRQSQRLESVGRLAGGIAHDFNNMLTAINGYSDLTLKKLKADDPLRSYIEEIRKAGDRSTQLTHQLLAFSRRQVLKPKVIDLNKTVMETGAMLERLIGEDIDLIFTLSPELGSVEADPGQLTQVIMNLAVNSRDAMPNGGHITVETANRDIDEEYAAKHAGMSPGSYVMLAVSDTGIGMSDDVKAHLFEPFFTTKKIGIGTGLGLATVYGIVKQSGGYVWVYSEVGQGASVKVYLPRVDAKVDEIQIGIDPSANLNGDETILLVEDEEIVRKLSKQILETCGYTVFEASDGTEALAICQQADKSFDLLLTDVVMPKMSGRQLVQHLADIRPDLKVLYMSGYTDDSIVRHGVIEATEHFIQKPFTFNALAGKVRELLDARS